MNAPNTSHRPPEITTGPADLASAVAHSSATVVAVGYTCDDDSPVIDAASVDYLEALAIDPYLLLERRGGTGVAGRVIQHEVLSDSGPEVVALVGLGDGSTKALRKAGAATGRLAKSRGHVVTAMGTTTDADGLAAWAEGATIGPFAYDLKTGEERSAPGSITLVGVTDDAPVRRGGRMAAASWQARMYALTPSNLKNPSTLERWARAAAKDGGLEIESWSDAKLRREGCGGILAVGAGSQHSSRLIRLAYEPSAAARKGRRGRVPHVVLVGKGITFDTGGLSLKPGAAMETMKRDMTGGAVVIAVMSALRDLNVPVRVTGLVAAAENALGANSMRPGDVVTHYGGRTSVVNNTDAEGRLVMADALAYADAELDPDVVIDIATLTGAGKVALGLTLGGLFTNDDDLAARLRTAGAAAGEPLWRLPLSDDYAELLDHPMADVDNAAGTPGATTAALFLQGFVGSRTWAHLDIASVGDSPVDELEYTKGATGFGARLLLHHLMA